VGLIQTLLHPLEDLFNRIFGGTIVGKLVAKIRDGIGHVTTLLSRIQTLVDSIKGEVSAFKNWREDVRIRSRVISIPAAVDQTKDLINELRDAYQAVIDIVQGIKEQLNAKSAEADAEEMASELGELGDVGESLLKRLPKLSKGLEKALGAITLVVEMVIFWSNIVDELQKIVDAIRDLREEVESGSTIFLSQKRKRKTVKLADGGSIKIRLGNLH